MALVINVYAFSSFLRFHSAEGSLCFFRRRRDNSAADSKLIRFLYMKK